VRRAPSRIRSLDVQAEMRRRGSACAEMEFGVVLWCSETSSSGRCGRACSWYDPARDDGEPWISGAGGAWAEAKVGRVSCPQHGVVVERVPWPGTGIALKGQAEGCFSTSPPRRLGAVDPAPGGQD
jgi:hypothetical protein